MFNKELSRGKSPETRALILKTAVELFRARGLEETTMREVAAASGVALGGAYYYFASKEAIILAYYDELQLEHERRVREGLAAQKLDLKERLQLAIHAKLDILQPDRKLLGVLFRFTAEPQHPLSPLSPATEAVREQSRAILEMAIGDERLPDDIRTVLPRVLWALQMGILLYFIYDTSDGQQRTRRFVDGAVTLLVRILSLARLSVLKPVRRSMLALLREAELVPAALPTATLPTKE